MRQTSGAWTFRDGPHDIEGLVSWTVEARDGEVGKVDDASLDAGEGAIVVATGPVLLGHMVLLPAGLVERVDPEHRRVHVGATREQIESSPRRRTSVRLDDEDFRARVAAHYGLS
ncbi:hypothetical protein ATJ97_3686 [Georgenia soli]|uniref:PRC-barrel domain protein n=1 Tax=Georgenia soli TaxID=638953 RepID=A0A2A9EQG2_9MICO|nr:PRC-barrel domain-containing protein [Georgenia soli]PFG41138.1 hypothetical protein ATJ97_3686 [Georgenia soli]